MLVHAAEKIERRRLFHPPPALILSDGMRVADMSVAENNRVMRTDPPCLPCAQRRAVLLSCRLAAVTSGDQQHDHALRLALAGRFVQERQFAQRVRIAQGRFAV